MTFFYYLYRRVKNQMFRYVKTRKFDGAWREISRVKFWNFLREKKKEERKLVILIQIQIYSSFKIILNFLQQV